MTETAFPGALREWRSRRRVSQLELAVRAGTTQRHVSFIESGRSAPGRAMVIRLAESLELPLRERNELLLAAGYAPAYPQTGLTDPALEPVLGALNAILDGHLPYPAVVVNRHGDVVAANAAFTGLIAGVAPALLSPPVSVARVLLHPDGLAARIINLDEWGWHVVDRLRAESVRNPDDRLRALAAELTGLIPPRPRDLGPHHLGFAVPLRLRAAATPPPPRHWVGPDNQPGTTISTGDPQPADGELRFVTTLTHFGTATDVTVSELRLEAFLPADQTTAAALLTDQSR
jgi:transcriptional regulator with XRE-family HTH domain